jgi:hypothetical protein
LVIGISMVASKHEFVRSGRSWSDRTKRSFAGRGFIVNTAKARICVPAFGAPGCPAMAARVACQALVDW